MARKIVIGFIDDASSVTSPIQRRYDAQFKPVEGKGPVTPTAVAGDQDASVLR
jgi:hypothetical protein